MKLQGCWRQRQTIIKVANGFEIYAAWTRGEGALIKYMNYNLQFYTQITLIKCRQQLPNIKSIIHCNALDNIVLTISLSIIYLLLLQQQYYYCSQMPRNRESHNKEVNSNKKSQKSKNHNEIQLQGSNEQHELQSQNLMHANSEQNNSDNEEMDQDENIDQQDCDESNSYCINSLDYYEVQKILDRRISFGKKQYLIKWKDWDLPEHNTWEGMTNLKGLQNMIEEFQKQLKLKKQKQTKQIKKSTKTMNPNIENIKQKIRKKSKNQQSEKLRKKMQQDKLKQVLSILRSKSEGNLQRVQKNKIMQLESSSSEEQKNYNSTRLPSNTPSYGQVGQKLTRQKNKIKKRQSLKSLPRSEQKSVKQIKDVPNIPKQTQQQKKKVQLTIGNINSYMLEQNIIYYEVDVCNERRETIGVKKVISNQLKQINAQKLSYFLQQVLVDIDIQQKQYEEYAKNHKQQLMKENEISIQFIKKPSKLS